MKLRLKIAATFFLLISTIIFNGCIDPPPISNSIIISGIITDTNKALLSNVKVTVTYNSTKAVLSDENGKYSLSDIPASTLITLHIEKAGFTEQQHEITTTTSVMVLNYELSREGDNLTINGLVLDIFGEPLAGATVVSGVASTQSDAFGAYSLGVSTSENINVTATHPMYAANSRKVDVSSGDNLTLNLNLAPIDASAIFDVRDGALIKTKGAQVNLAANSIVNEDGSIYAGNVVANAAFNQVSSSLGKKAFPGDYMGVQSNGEETVLQSYGFIDVTLADEAGNPLKLAEGETATLTYPMDDNISATPASIPLWYYDIVNGSWIEDGIAHYDAVTNSYSGQVSHFTTWNLDAKVASADLSGCIVDVNGAAIQSASVTVTAQGWNRSFVNYSDTGQFTLLNAPANLELSLVAEVNGKISSVKRFTLVANQHLDALGQCLVVELNVSELSMIVKGKLINEQLHGADLDAFYYEWGERRYVDLSVDNNGIITSSPFMKPAFGMLGLHVKINGLGNPVESFYYYPIDEFQAELNIGTIDLRTSEVTGCIVDSQNNPVLAPDYGSNIFIDQPFKSESLSTSSLVSDGSFNIHMFTDGLQHSLYAFNNNNTASVKTTFNANADQINFGVSCLQLNEVIPKGINVSFVTPAPDGVTYSVYYSELEAEINEEGSAFVDTGSEALQLESASTGTFTANKDGVYIAILSHEGYGLDIDYSGIKLHVTLGDEINEVITVPVDTVLDDYPSWYSFQVTVLDGEATFKAINTVELEFF